ncbi:glycosyltransferase involved in cell wall biosynthesis [Paenibacillus taihuensis]|uniref:Glycosyltransferase involved in cell wall biosynthesis n=1 Tax=Paenibacillus taihuensis TaxID=1156355 RepID=A0A3D9SB54_9BACL|nr:glycosyltransferase [Paenibacillus taihuensis]REE90516.1 glycosyltransferase involved in cell wall biosynthesis [Paenibacillus taihuensis]
MRILYFSTVNWKWIKQRPHFIAQYLSVQGHEVDYFSINPIGKTRVQKHAEGRLRIRDTYVLPFALKNRWIERFNIWYFQKKLSVYQYDIIVLTNPLQLQYIPKRLASNCSIIYECMDNMPYFYNGHLRERMFIEERRMLGFVDGVITSSRKLKSEIYDRSPNKELTINTIHNAVDKTTLSQAPESLTLQGPNLIYIGTISHWLDWDTLYKFAAKYPHYTLYFVGPVDVELNLLPNMILVGVVEHSRIIDYIHYGDIMLLPFSVNELTKTVDPVKMYEYLSLNKPVISTYWPELDKFECDNLGFYRDFNQFEELVNAMSRIKSDFSINYTFMIENQWENRVEKYDSFLNELINQK